MSNQVVYMRHDDNTSFRKSIRAKCLDCSDGSPVEVRNCPVVNCPLWTMRFGVSPKSAVHRLSKTYRVEFID
mgnify:CR=1|jgi:hypothetical protein